MTAALITLGVLSVLGATGYLVVKYIRRSQANEVEVGHLDAAVKAGTERVSRLEAAEAARRDRVRKDIDAKVREVHSADDAARLLREVFPGPRDPKAPR